MASNLLIDEYPVLVLPSLAEKIGLNEAIVLQQVHYWTVTFERADKDRHYRDGRWWVYNTYQEWQTNFPWWSARTIERALLSLRERGLLLATDEYNQKNYDRTLWYAIDYEVLESLTPNCGEGVTPDCGDGSRQNGVMEDANLAPPIPETNTETTTDTEPPVGGGYAADPVLVIHDLEEIAYLMEGTGRKKDDLEAQCPECGAAHDQETNTCPDCGAFVVWENSRVWKRMYGKPRDAIAQIEGRDLKPATPLEVEFCRAFNRRERFANVTQQKQFRRLARAYPDGYLRELMGWARGKGFTAFRSAADNPDNLTKYRDKHGLSTTEEQPGERDQPSGWELLALEAAQEGG